MKFRKILLHDINDCAKSKYLYLLLEIFVSVSLYFECYNQLVAVKLSENISGKGSFIDYWICLIQGKEEYIFSIGTSYEFPTNWFLLFVIILIPVCIYTWNDINGYGQQLIVRGKSRRNWLMSKFVWAGLLVIVYFLLMLLVTLLFCLWEGIELNLRPTWYMMELCGRSRAVDLAAGKLLVLYFLQPFLLMLLLCYIEIMFMVYLPKTIAFLCTSGLLIVSLFYKSYFLVGNLGIPVRMQEIDESGLSGNLCVFILVVHIILVVMIGNYGIKRRDII